MKGWQPYERYGDRPDYRPWFALLGMVLLLFGVLYYRSWKKEVIRHHLSITMGVVRGITFHKNSESVEFDYLIKGKFLSGSCGLPGGLTWRHAEVLVAKRFPVAYDTTHPGRSELLMTPSTFQYYGLPYPDSVQWLSDYIDRLNQRH